MKPLGHGATLACPDPGHASRFQLIAKLFDGEFPETEMERTIVVALRYRNVEGLD